MPRDRSWPPAPEPLPVEVVDNHTHLQMAVGWTAGPDLPEWRGSVDYTVGLPGGAEVMAEALVMAGRSKRDAWDHIFGLRKHLNLAASVGVTRVVEVGCDLDSLETTAGLAESDPRVLGAVAIHPNEAALHAGVRQVGPDGLAPRVEPRHDVPLDDALAAVARVAAAHDRVRVVGETGLDYFRTSAAGRAAQREAFRAHLAIARELDLAVQVHDRDAHADLVEVLVRDGAPARTVIHCFSGDAELARTCAEHGWACSFAGPLTYRANDALRAAAAVLPEHLLLVETDAPFLTPVPYRGRPNASYLVPLTVVELARVRGLGVAETGALVTANALRLYGPW
ncbi:MAG: TatD family hydrolase [Micrococcales bacterium]|nr:TatD family hydrolase [Micrococcales bacterium]